LRALNLVILTEGHYQTYCL